MKVKRKKDQKKRGRKLGEGNDRTHIPEQIGKSIKTVSEKGVDFVIHQKKTLTKTL